MATPLPMPKLGLTMEEGTILKWLKSDGEAVEKGEIILQIQTDKVEYDVEAPDGGLLLQTFADEGDIVPCGDNIAIIGGEDEDISFLKPTGPPATELQSPPQAEPSFQSSPTTSDSASNKRVFASPAARRVAREMGIDYRTLRGTGPGGRIVRADVRVAADLAAATQKPEGIPTAQGGPPAIAQTTPVDGIRKVIIERMGISWEQVPRITLQAEVDLTNLLAVREASKAAWESDLGVKVSINDLLTFYTARAIRRCPLVNVQLTGNEISQMQDINIGIAVALETGLVVPVIRGQTKNPLTKLPARPAH